MTPEMMLLAWFGGLGLLTIIIYPLLALARINRNTRRTAELLEEISKLNSYRD